MLLLNRRQTQRSFPMTSVAQIAEAMKTLLTGTAERLGRETQFVRRQSKVTGAVFAQMLVWGWQQSPAASLSTLAQGASTMGTRLTPQGLAQRFNKPAATFLYELLQSAMTTVVSAKPVAIPLLQRFSAVLVRDSTIISLPDALAEVWQGCGNAARRHVAALKVQVNCDLLTGTLCDLLLASGRTHDCVCARALAPVPPGALCLADLGYFRLAFLRAVSEGGAYFVSRLFVPTSVFTPTGVPVELADRLRAHTTGPIELALVIGATDRLPVRLVAAPVPQEVADQRRRQLYDEARRRGRAVSRARLDLADWTIFITNASPDLLSVADIFVLARLRWQVELLFKLWKQHGRVDEWRSQQPWRILCEVYAKLLALLLAHWILIALWWEFPDRSLVRAATTLRAHTVLLRYALAGHFDLATVLALLAVAVRGCSRQEHRRKHPAAYQLLLEPALAF
jgi:hypothetical protein